MVLACRSLRSRVRFPLSRLACAQVWEQPAEFYCPVIASLVTGGSHLLCAMLERKVRDMGGQIAAMDTDSAMIVSTKNGGLVPCAGGEHRLEAYRVASGHSASRALSFPAVDHIRDAFEALNLWHDTLKVPFLRLRHKTSRRTESASNST